MPCILLVILKEQLIYVTRFKQLVVKLQPCQYLALLQTLQHSGSALCMYYVYVHMAINTYVRIYVHVHIYVA